LAPPAFARCASYGLASVIPAQAGTQKRRIRKTLSMVGAHVRQLQELGPRVRGDES